MNHDKVSEAAFKRADKLVIGVWESQADVTSPYAAAELALARVIQERSDVAREVMAYFEMTTLGQRHPTREAVQSLILPDDPDPLVEALRAVDEKAYERTCDLVEDAANLRAELARRNLKIVEAGHE